MAISPEEEAYIAEQRRARGEPPDPNAGNNAPTGPTDQRNTDSAIYNTGVSSDPNKPSTASVVRLPGTGNGMQQEGGVVSNANPWVATKGKNGEEVNAYLNPYFQAAPGTNDYNHLGDRAIAGDVGRLGRETSFQAAGAQATGAQLDPTQQAQFRDRQMQLGEALQQQANGQGPSVAGSQLQQSTEQNLQAALAQSASSRGGNLGAMQYQLGNARANIQQQAAQGLAQNRIQEQFSARQQLGDVLNAGRGGDINMAAQNAQLGQQNNQFNASMLQGNNQFNANADNTQQARIDDIKSRYVAMGMSAEQVDRQIKIDAEKFRIGTAQNMYGLERGIAAQQQAAQQAQTNQLIGAGFQAGGSIISSALK